MVLCNSEEELESLEREELFCIEHMGSKVLKTYVHMQGRVRVCAVELGHTLHCIDRKEAGDAGLGKVAGCVCLSGRRRRKGYG